MGVNVTPTGLYHTSGVTGPYHHLPSVTILAAHTHHTAYLWDIYGDAAKEQTAV